MTRTNDEIPSDRAERLLADRTSFHLPLDAWDELVVIMDREAKPKPKLATLLRRSGETFTPEGAPGSPPPLSP